MFSYQSTEKSTCFVVLISSCECDVSQLCNSVYLFSLFLFYVGQVLLEVARTLGVKCHPRGTMITIEGPRFSSRAESLMFRQWGADVINMTTVPEVVLAKEAGLCYASIAMATDYDCWKEHEEAVSVWACEYLHLHINCFSFVFVFNALSEGSQHVTSHLKNEERNCPGSLICLLFWNYIRRTRQHNIAQNKMKIYGVELHCAVWLCSCYQHISKHTVCLHLPNMLAVLVNNWDIR